MRLSILLFSCFASLAVHAAALPFSTVFKGQDRFEWLVRQADRGNWKTLPIGDRTSMVGRALVGTPYKSFTLEIDDRIEAPSVNFLGLDCWTFFETSLAFARMLDTPKENWTSRTLLHFIELDRYRGGQCTGSYLSRLHYLEDWAQDNQQRGLVKDLTRSLGGVRVPHEAREMTAGWKSYRYLRNNPSLRAGIARMEERISAMPMYHIPKAKVASIEPSLRNGDIISITTLDSSGISTSHVGIAVRDAGGVLRFMHASSPRNYGQVVVDARLSDYLYRFGTHAGIMVARPLK